MKKILLLFSMVCMLSFVSCGVNNKDEYMVSFDSFVTEIENKRVITEREYRRMSAKFEEYSRKYYNKYKDQLSPRELGDVARIKARYVKAMANHHIDEAGNALKEAAEEARQAAEDAKNAASNAGEDAMDAAEKAGKEVKKATRKAADKVEDIRKEVFD